ncbi:MAG TPA: hypothetical protein VGG33_18575 [Polyangia bacterium]
MWASLWALVGAGPARSAVVVVVGAFVGFGAACDEPPGPRPPSLVQPFRIDVDVDETHVKPNESRQVVFSLRDAVGRPVAGRVLQLTIDAPDRARGATLSVDRGVTGPLGEVAVQIIGGQPTEFSVRASSTSAPEMREVRVRVTAQESGPVAIAPEIATTLPSGVRVNVVRVAVIENMTCASLPRSMSLPVSARSTMLGREIVFGTVAAVGGHAVVGHGLDAAGIVLVQGCLDLSGRSVRADTTIHLALPLSLPEISATGHYRAVSQLRFMQEPPRLRQLRAAWGNLDACELDPARIWLDCTVDALGPITANDPLDCNPSTFDESIFDSRLSARRGLRVATSADGRCRGELDGAGHASLEKQIMAMFASSPQLTADLKAIAADGRKLLDSFRLLSTMSLSATSQPGHLQLDHHLNALEVAIGAATISVDVPDLGAAVLSARFVSAEATRRDITIDRHGFTLRLGSLARLAFIRGALMNRGYPADTTKFIQGVFANASYFDRNVTHKGCAAMAAMVCPLVGGADGCLTDACNKGLAALGQSLDDAFSTLDGFKLDFFLQGGAPLLDRDGDGFADAIGYLLPNPGVWKALVLLDDEQVALPGFFTADRIAAP